jgi:mRNA interferase MazF
VEERTLVTTLSDIRRGQIWWADMPEPRGSEPGFRRPVLVVQANEFNQSRISTILIAAITTNLSLANAPGNVLLPRRMSGLRHESVINVTQLLALDRSFLIDEVGRISPPFQALVDEGLRLVLQLGVTS